MSGAYDLSVIIEGQSINDIASFVSQSFLHLIPLFQPQPTLS